MKKISLEEIISIVSKSTGISKKDINDHERYILNHQLDVLKRISV